MCSDDQLSIPGFRAAHENLRYVADLSRMDSILWLFESDNGGRLLHATQGEQP
jgi:hypothetical protein